MRVVNVLGKRAPKKSKESIKRNQVGTDPKYALATVRGCRPRKRLEESRKIEVEMKQGIFKGRHQ